VLWNLCSNALRAMTGGGTLKVSLRACGADWEIGIADTGRGISPQQIEKMFEPFQSKFEGGTGLGLAIVYQIVQAHDGKISVRSAPGQGTEVTLYLRRAPRCEQAGAHSEQGSAPADAAPVALRAAGPGRTAIHG
jgi:signal transduction histidine kinase